MGELGGFLKYKRKDPGYREKEERLGDYRAVERQLSQREIKDQAARCMDCGTPFCHAYGCPAANVIPELNELVYRGRWEEALHVLVSANPLPEFTGRVCPALCEAACVAGLNWEPVNVRQVELAIVEKAYENGYLHPEPPAVRREERVAVVGSGPAGLAAADALNRAGYWVTVYESARRPGGLLRYGIPDFKLEKWVINRRIELMEKEGITFETGVTVGTDISYRYLKNRFDAVCFAGGARKPRDLNVPGRELKGIHLAMEYLTQQNKIVAGEPLAGKEITAQGKSVVVIGGGDTGSDCLGSALRQGARQVYQFEILPKPSKDRPESTPWPMWPNMMRESHAHKEGGQRRWSVMTKEFLGGEGRLEALRCVEVDWRVPEGGDAPIPMERPGTEFEVEAELVLLAMGFVGPERKGMIEQLGISLDAKGNVKADDDHMTSVEGIFVAGDMSTGQSLVVRAIADGRKTAQAINRYLQKKSNFRKSPR